MYTFVYVLTRLIDVLELLILIRCILSWIPGLQNAFTELIYKITDPFMFPVQNLISRVLGGRGMMVDFSPVVLYFVLEFVRRLLYAILL